MASNRFQRRIECLLDKIGTPFLVLVGVLLIVGLAIACTNDDAPIQPVIRLHYGGQVYDGVPGNFCWPKPMEPEVSVCGVETAFPWQDLDLSAIPVKVGDRIIAEIEVDDRPQKLRAAIFEETSEHASVTAVQVVELSPGLKSPLAVDLPIGVYNMRITGQWGVGDQAYKFRLKVE